MVRKIFKKFLHIHFVLTIYGFLNYAVDIELIEMLHQKDIFQFNYKTLFSWEKIYKHNQYGKLCNADLNKFLTTQEAKVINRTKLVEIIY